MLRGTWNTRWFGQWPLFAMAILLLLGCGQEAAPAPTPRTSRPEEFVPRLTPAPGIPGDPNAGRQLFVRYGCAGCHTLYGVPTARGVAGPNLTNVVLRPTLAGTAIPMTPENLTLWLIEPSALEPDTPMPGVGLTEQQARDIMAFLYSQPQNP